MKTAEKKLDRLVQMLHLGRRCAMCGCNAEAVHHIVGRANTLLRYAPINLMPVCTFCHRRIHDVGIDISDYLKDGVYDTLMRYKNKSYKDMLTFELKMSEEEWLEECGKTLTKLILK